MNTFKSIGNRVLISALLSAAVGLHSTATPANTDSFFLERSGAPVSEQIAFSAKTRPAFRNSHKKNKGTRADLANLESKLNDSTALREPKRKTRGSHRRAPYSRKR
jgi:hypothetical protein